LADLAGLPGLGIFVRVQGVGSAIVRFVVDQLPPQTLLDRAAHLGDRAAYCVDVDAHHLPVHLAVVHYCHCAQHLQSIHTAGCARLARNFLNVNRVRVAEQVCVVIFLEG